MLLEVALLLSIAGTPVDGGTPAQRKELESLLSKVPDCLRSADGKTVPVHIVGGAGNDAETRGSRQEINAEYREPEGRRPHAVYVNQALFQPYYGPAVAASAANSCGDPAVMRGAMNPLAMITHEFAHHFHLSGTWRDAQGRPQPNKRLIDEFLAIKWRAARAAALADPQVKKLMRDIARMEASGPPRRGDPAAFQASYCQKVKALDEKMKGYGFPARFAGDGPYTASDPDGAEYFAVAMETLIYHPDVFEKAYSPAEQRWLAANFGECIATFPARSPRYEENARAIRRLPPAAPAGGGQHR